MHDRHGQRQALTNTERQFGGCLPCVGLQPEALHQLGDALPPSVVRQMKEAGVQIEVGRNRQFTVQRKGLRHVADLLACLQIVCIDQLAKQVRLAFGGRQQAGEHLHGGRLSAAVGT